MKVDIIKASADGDFKEYKRSRGGLPQNIFSLAGATPPDIAVRLLDESVDCRVDPGSDADLVAIMFSTPDAPRGYALADSFRARGKTVVFGGLHPSFLPEEALAHGDAVIVGEAEGVWERLLADFRGGRLERIYRAEAPFDLARLKPYPTDLLGPSHYDWIWTVTVSRGCPFNCEFCTVNRFFRGLRYRPVEHVVAEVRGCGAGHVELKADNLTADRGYCLELFRALEPLGINWSTSTDIRLADDPELLDAAVRSGLSYVLLGIETPSDRVLRGAGKGFVRSEALHRQVARFHEGGVIVDAAALFGFDGQGPEAFRETLDFFESIEVDVCDPVIVVPFPGTRLFDRLEGEGRILTRDWARYDGSHAVFRPSDMTPAELEMGAYWFYEQWNAPARRASRKKRQTRQLGRENAQYIADTF